MEPFDLIAIGAGNAALAAAVSAHDAGLKRVLVLEKAPRAYRGGNTRCAGGMFRFVFDKPEALRRLYPDLAAALPDYSRAVSPYSRGTYLAALGADDNGLAAQVVDQSFDTVAWMVGLGITLTLASELAGVIRENRLTFPSGIVLRADDAARSLSEAWFQIAEARGIEVRYRAAAESLLESHGCVTGVRLDDGEVIEARAVVLGCGGFEANPEMRAVHLGPSWRRAKVRGTAYNTGDGLRMAAAVGAGVAGAWDQCHACPIGAESPDFGDDEPPEGRLRIGFHLGVTLNQQGRRFIDEGSAFPLQAYSTVGARILGQPGGLAYQIFDSTVLDQLPSHYRAQGSWVQASDLAELLAGLDLDPEVAMGEISAFNAACAGNRADYSRLDRVATCDISPAKSNWAMPIAELPFRAYPVTGGITFTYGGLAVDRDARVLDKSNRHIPGLYACGELVGGIFGNGYVGGAGLVSGATFGRAAGDHAARTLVGAPSAGH